VVDHVDITIAGLSGSLTDGEPSVQPRNLVENLTGLSSNIQRIFGLTELVNQFNIYNTNDKAVASFN